jgi:hypothetical protein
VDWGQKASAAINFITAEEKVTHPFKKASILINIEKASQSLKKPQFIWKSLQK